MSIAARRDVFQAIADPTRRQIIGLIAKRSMNLNTIAENFEMSRPAISQHIKILVECGMVKVRQEGRERYCEVKPEGFAEVYNWVEQHKKLWAARFSRIDELLTEMQTTDKKTNKRKTRK
jgi:DNA-binding transcriptional ArsR family regulator